MIDDDFYLSLPDDPEEGFGIFEARVIDELGEPDANNENVEQEYCHYICAYCLEFNIDLGTSLEVNPGEEYFQFYTRLKGAAGLKAKRSSMKRLRRLKSGSFGCYVLLPAQKVEIRHYIDKIKVLIDLTHLTDEKRRELVKRLNAFADAVEIDRTKVEALHSLYVVVKKEAKGAKDEFKDELKPILDLVDRINSVIEKASEYLGLSKSDEKKQLPSPPKRIEGPKANPKGKYELDDDIPF